MTPSEPMSRAGNGLFLAHLILSAASVALAVVFVFCACGGVS